MFIEKVVENLTKIKNVEAEDLEEEIIAAYGDYNFKGETEVIVSSPNVMNGFEPKEGSHSTHINHSEAPEIIVQIKEAEDGLLSVVDAWEV